MHVGGGLLGEICYIIRRGPLCMLSDNCIGMWYLGELTKLCAYDFKLNVAGLFSSMGRARCDCVTSVICCKDVPHYIINTLMYVFKPIEYLLS